LINSDPYGNGWICEIEVAANVDSSHLLTASEYSEFVAG
jgi:glycine cleavage system H lipoate-binding protein